MIGQDNCYHGSTSRDTNFMWLMQGKVRVGDFNTTLPSTGAPPQLERLELQVEGHARIRTLDVGAVAAANVTCAAASKKGVDLCAAAEAAEATAKAEVASLKLEMAEMRSELRELKALVRASLKSDDQSRRESEALKLPWHVDPPTVNIQLGQELAFPSSSQTIDIKAQRGECEGVQVWLPAIAEGNESVYAGELQNVSVSVGDLTRTDSVAMDEQAAGLPRSSWRFYQQGYVNASGTHAYMCMCGPDCSSPCYCGCGDQCDPYPRKFSSAPAFLTDAYEHQSRVGDGWFPSW